jgi:glycosyltransferase involved in cell wall biosynthesis
MPPGVTSQPLVSVVIPVYNGARFLAEAIESVLAQTYRTFEVVVVDDGSTDSTPDIARGYTSVRYVRRAHEGTAAARNHGVRNSTGEFLAFLDADDLWMPDKLRLQMQAFEADPGLEIVSGLVEQFVTPDLEGRYSIPAAPQEGYSTIAMVIRRRVLEDLGGFEKETLTAETIAWFVQLADRKISMRILPDVVARRRIHGDNATLRNREEKHRNMMQILRSSIERKRAAGKRQATW